MARHSALPLGPHTRVAIEAAVTIIRQLMQEGGPAAISLPEVERALQEPLPGHKHGDADHLALRRITV